jgi:hypothetical protein
MGQLRRTPGQGVPPAQGPRFGHSGSALRQAGQIIFEEFGGSPGNSYTWVDLIHMPFVAASRRALADLSGCLAELLPPLAHGLVGHANPARRQHFFDHAKAQGKPEIEPNRMADHLRRKTMALVERVAGCRHGGRIAARPRFNR